MAGGARPARLRLRRSGDLERRRPVGINAKWAFQPHVQPSITTPRLAQMRFTFGKWQFTSRFHGRLAWQFTRDSRVNWGCFARKNCLFLPGPYRIPKERQKVAHNLPWRKLTRAILRETLEFQCSEGAAGGEKMLSYPNVTVM